MKGKFKNKPARKASKKSCGCGKTIDEKMDDISKGYDAHSSLERAITDAAKAAKNRANHNIEFRRVSEDGSRREVSASLDTFGAWRLCFTRYNGEARIDTRLTVMADAMDNILRCMIDCKKTAEGIPLSEE